MIESTFLHCSGIGPTTEQRLWASGALTWNDVLAGRPPCLRDRSWKRLASEIHASQAALAGRNGRFFSNRLAAKHHWRLYPAFRAATAFLDIETTGLSFHDDEITTIAVHDGQHTRTYVNGRNLDRFPDDILGYGLLVTYNGRCFDVPFLEAKFPGLRLDQPHIDLRYMLASLGYRGGLKGCEQSLGISRPGGLDGVDGFMAVRLWHAHLRGDHRALPALLRYNVEDTVNLRWLMDTAYNMAVAELPVSAPKLAVAALSQIDMGFDAEIIRELKHDSPGAGQIRAMRIMS